MWIVRTWNEKAYKWLEVARFEDVNDALAWAAINLANQSRSFIRERL